MDNIWWTYIPAIMIGIIGFGYILLIILGCYKQDVAKKTASN